MNLFSNDGEVVRAAVISDCQRFRYSLTRQWNPSLKSVGWVMLNPSTADGMVDDPTIKKCVKFARAWVYGGIVVANLFHLRATNPDELMPQLIDVIYADAIELFNRIAAHAVGPEVDLNVYNAVMACPMVIAAWGSHDVVKPGGRDIVIKAAAKNAGRDLHCLAVNKDGSPRHPLYLRDDAKPVVWCAAPTKRGEA